MREEDEYAWANQEREQRTVEALRAAWENRQTSEDVLYLAAECGVKDLFDMEIKNACKG